MLPDSADGISALSWLEMRALAIRLLAEPQTSDADKTVTNAPPVAATGGTTTL